MFLEAVPKVRRSYFFFYKNGLKLSQKLMNFIFYFFQFLEINLAIFFPYKAGSIHYLFLIYFLTF
jgi:hypothetical protein